MAHYAFLDSNNIVTEVITGKDEGEEGIDWEQHYGEFRGQPCKRTSYNTSNGIHTNGGVPYRKNYAAIGYTFDSTLDAFIPPKPFPSWVFVEETCNWTAPTSRPSEEGKVYTWQESTTSWVEMTL